MKKELLENYAKLIVRVGANVKPHQRVVVQADIDQPEFVYKVVEEAYNCGADKVEVEWSYQPLTKLHVEHRKTDVLTEVEAWEVEKYKSRHDRLPAMIYLLSEDPDGLVGIDREKYAAMVGARYKAFKKLRDEMENRYQWCIAAVPGKKWAKKMFPELSESDAGEALWTAILKTSRCTGDGIAAWDAHNKALKARCDWLNRQHFKALRYASSNGTDLTVGLMPNALFLGGGEYTLSGNFFNPNIPSEEVFTTPMRGHSEGIVYSSKPLCYRGELIENFYLKFENGRVVESHAEKNDALLTTILNMDEGARYLGECALVPYDSPIQNSGLLFYNTLFDENAACHLALGEGFSNCIENYDRYTLKECRKMGVNESMIHEDFMIGTEDLQIFGLTSDNTEVPIFKDGNWA